MKLQMGPSERALDQSVYPIQTRGVGLGGRDGAIGGGDEGSDSGVEQQWKHRFRK